MILPVEAAISSRTALCDINFADAEETRFSRLPIPCGTVGSLPANFTRRQTRTPSTAEIRSHSSALAAAGSRVALLVDSTCPGATGAPGASRDRSWRTKRERQPRTWVRPGAELGRLGDGSLEVVQACTLRPAYRLRWWTIRSTICCSVRPAWAPKAASAMSYPLWLWSFRSCRWRSQVFLNRMSWAIPAVEHFLRDARVEC